MVEFHGENEDLPPIRMMICKGKEDVTIKVRHILPISHSKDIWWELVLLLSNFLSDRIINDFNDN